METLPFPQIENLIRYLVRSFLKRAPYLDQDTLMSEGQLAYLEALEDYKPEESLFTTHLWHKVTQRLLDVKEKAYWEKSHRPIIELDKMPTKENFNLQQFLLELSEDAKLMVQLTLEPPEEKKTVRSKRSGLIAYLKDVGWTMSRIHKGFAELREILQ